MVSSGKTSLFAALSEIMEGEVETNEGVLLEGSFDRSCIRVRPQAVIFPKTSKDIATIFTFAKEYRLPLSVRGNGTSTSGGSLTEGIQVDTSRHFTKIHAIDIKNNTATIGAGAEIKHIMSRLNEWGVMCPLFGYDVLERSIGGMVAENAITAASLTHGDMRLWVESLTMVLDNGEEHLIKDGLVPSGRLLEICENLHPLIHAKSKTVHASKAKASSSTSGYNILNQGIGLKQVLDIIVGSEGTLGVITSITIRLLPSAKYTYTIACGASSFLEIENYVKHYKKHKADTLFVCDGSLFGKTDTSKEPPYLISVLSSPYIVVGTFASKDGDRLLNEVNTAKEKLLAVTTRVFAEEGTFLARNVYNKINPVIAEFTKETYTPISVFDGISVPEEEYGKAGEAICKKLDTLDLPYIIGGAAGSSIISVLFFVNTGSDRGRKDLQYALTDISKIIEHSGGEAIGGNGDGIVRTPYMGISADPHMRNLYREIQQLFDAHQILNVGKKTFITSEYMLKHVRKPKDL